MTMPPTDSSTDEISGTESNDFANSGRVFAEMSTVDSPLGTEADQRTDAELIEDVRGGQIAAYGELYRRHVGAARNLARQLTKSAAEHDDLVSEAFTKVLDSLRAGGGPENAFR